MELVGFNEPGVRITFDLLPDEDAIALVVGLGARHHMRLASVVSVRHEGRRVAVVRMVGPEAAGFIDAIWRSGHRVADVAHCP
jgi:hypothetical protein